jgi:hypothetical protein
MRHRGIEIHATVNDIIAAGHDGLRGVGWLTLLGAALAKELGGAAKLKKTLGSSAEVFEARHGLLLKAGERPRMGDTNRKDFLPEYRAVYAACKPVIERAIARSKSLSLASPEYKPRTLAWLRRLGDE